MKRITASPATAPGPRYVIDGPLTQPSAGKPGWPGRTRSGGCSGAVPTTGHPEFEAPGRRFANDPILVVNCRFVPTQTSVCHHFFVPSAALGILISKFPGVVSGRMSIWTPFVFVSKPAQAPAGGVLVRPATKISVPARRRPGVQRVREAARRRSAGRTGSARAGLLVEECAGVAGEDVDRPRRRRDRAATAGDRAARSC